MKGSLLLHVIKSLLKQKSEQKCEKQECEATAPFIFQQYTEYFIYLVLRVCSSQQTQTSLHAKTFTLLSTGFTSKSLHTPFTIPAKPKSN